jgi:hypothetical protein
MAIIKIADGAFFVPAYSTQTITPDNVQNLSHFQD